MSLSVLCRRFRWQPAHRRLVAPSRIHTRNSIDLLLDLPSGTVGRNECRLRPFSTQTNEVHDEASNQVLLLSAYNDVLEVHNDEQDDVELEKTTSILVCSQKQSPLWHLKCYYRLVLDTVINDEHFSVRSYNLNDNPTPRYFWSAVFRCPATGRSFASGTLKYELEGDFRSEESRNHGSSVLYGKLSVAKHAAAGRFLDVLRFEKLNVREPHFCKENPSLSLPMSEIPIYSGMQGVCELQRYYRENHDLDLNLEQLDCVRTYTRVGQGAHHYWTAAFTCPITKRRFLAGALHDCDGSVVNIDTDSNVASYKRKRIAQAAAACRALDVFAYESMGTLEPRYCEDDPSVSLRGEVILPSEDPAEKVVADHDSSVFQTDESASSVAQISSDVAVAASGNILDVSLPLFKSSEEEERQDDEYYFVAHIPDAEGTPPSHRLLEVASVVAKAAAVSGFGESLSRSTDKSPQGGAKEVIAAAQSWLESLSEESSIKWNPHRLILPRADSSATLLRGKAILAALADATQFSPLRTSFGIQGATADVIDALWKTENAKPDADAYTLYIKSIDEINPMRAVEKAASIIRAMRDGKKYKNSDDTLPKPNQNTMNAFIQLTAQLGGTSGRHAEHIDDDFRPNKESFLAVLSSAMYNASQEFETGGFDPVFARECVERMNELAEETEDESLLPDTQVYNAPLRWTGGPVLWAESRPYARYSPWQDYQQLLSKGLREEVEDGDLRVKEAKDMEAWLNSMEEESASNPRIAPNIETYEAVIQGWLRTRARLGLERAEAVLHRVLSSSEESTRPRLQTFHPIIATLLHSKDDSHGPKIMEWVDKWLDVETESGNRITVPDGRILELQMSARVHTQSKLLEDLTKSEEPDKIKSEIVVIAEQCSNILHAACNSQEQDERGGGKIGRGVESVHFMKVIHAWQHVGSAYDDTEMLERIISEMAQAAHLFESVLQAATLNAIPDGNIYGASDMSPRLEYLVTNAQSFFGALVDALAALSRERQLSEAALGRALLLIEKATRLVGECEEIEAHFSEQNEAMEQPWSSDESSFQLGRRESEDGFVYGLSGDDPFVPSRYAFLWRVTTALERVAVGRNGDIVRLCALVKDIGGARRPSKKLKEAVDRILDRVLPDSPHRLKRHLPHSSVRQRAAWQRKLPRTTTARPARGTGTKFSRKRHVNGKG